jgi:hypothetical protein
MAWAQPRAGAELAEVPTPEEVKEEAVLVLSCVASVHFRLRHPQSLLPSHVSAHGVCPSSLGRQREKSVQQRDPRCLRWLVLALPLLGRMVMGRTWLKTVKEAVLAVAGGSSRVS